jgi:hypothetical protein
LAHPAALGRIPKAIDPRANIGINVPVFPTFTVVPVPDYPVYAPQAHANLFFHDGLGMGAAGGVRESRGVSCGT